MKFLQAIGRAQPATQIRTALTQRAQEMRAEQQFQQQTELHKIQLETAQRQNEYQAKLMKEAETPVSWYGLARTFEGGPTGKVFQMVHEFSESLGYNQPSGGKGPGSELGTISQRHLTELVKRMQDLDFSTKLNTKALEHLYEQADILERIKKGDTEATELWTGEKITKKNLSELQERLDKKINLHEGLHKGFMEREKLEVEKKKARAALEKAQRPSRGNTVLERAHEEYLYRHNLTSAQYPLETFKRDHWPDSAGNLTDIQIATLSNKREERRQLQMQRPNIEMFAGGKGERSKAARQQLEIMDKQIADINAEIDEILKPPSQTKAPSIKKGEAVSKLPPPEDYKGVVFKETDEKGNILRRWVSDGVKWSEKK